MKRDEYGFIILDEDKLENLKNVKDGRIFSFGHQGQTYFYKQIAKVAEVYNELIAYFLASKMDLSCVEYDLASLDGEIGVISKNFLEGVHSYFTIEKILQNYFRDERQIEKKNNLQDIRKALSYQYQDIEVDSLVIQLMRVFMFDVLIGNIDRHSRNFMILEKEKPFLKIFDHEKMLSSTSIYEGGYSLGIDENDYFTTEEELDVEDHFVRKFMRVYSKDELALFQQYLKLIAEEEIERVLAMVEQKIQAKMIKPIREEIQYKFRENQKMLKKILTQ